MSQSVTVLAGHDVPPADAGVVAGSGRGWAASSSPVGVFIADQHPVVVAGLRMIFEQTGRYWVVGTAARTDDAHGSLARWRPRVCVVAADLPGGGSVRLLRQVRESRIPTQVVVTAEAPSAADASRSFDEGACGFIARAASADRFVDAVAAAANGSCYVDPALAFDVITARSRRARRASPFGLTPAEIAVLSQLPLGRTNREIGAALNISENTVKTHLSSVMRKIGARDRAEAAAFVVRHELTR